MSQAVPCVAGSTLHALGLAVEEMYGVEAHAAGLARLDPESRLLMSTIGAHLWVPVHVLTDSVDAWADAASVSAEELTVRGTRRATRRNMKTLWRVLLMITTDDALIARTPVLYSKTRNMGQLTATARSPHHARLTLTGWPNGTERQSLSLAVGLETVLELTRRPHARCTYRRTSDGGTYDLTWGDPSAPRRPYAD